MKDKFLACLDQMGWERAPFSILLQDWLVQKVEKLKWRVKMLLNIQFILTTEKDWVKIEPLKRKTSIIVFELNVTVSKQEDFFKILQRIA